MADKVLLTGVSGFLGSHTAIQLLEKGYSVAGTLRDMNRADSIKDIISNHTANIDLLSFVEADLNDAAVWSRIVDGVDYIQHIASPFPRELPKNEQDLIRPAKDGTLAIMRAAARHGVKRVVLTSSTGAIVYGKDKENRSGTYTEGDWTDFHNRRDTTPYFRSKTIAEKAAWDFVRNDDPDLELATVCPGAILGPILEEDFGTSANLVIKTLDGSVPALPNIGFDCVDVRSVANLLILAMEKKEAAGERFIGSSGYLKFVDIARILKRQYPDRKVPKAVLPNVMVRLFSNIDPTLKPILNDLGVERKVDHSKAKNLLGWNPTGTEEAVIACAESALELGLVK